MGKDLLYLLYLKVKLYTFKYPEIFALKKKIEMSCGSGTLSLSNKQLLNDNGKDNEEIVGVFRK